MSWLYIVQIAIYILPHCSLLNSFTYKPTPLPLKYFSMHVDGMYISIIPLFT